MSAALLKRMREMGLTLDQAIELMEVWEEGTAHPFSIIDSRREQKRVKDAERIAEKRHVARLSRDIPLETKVSPTPPSKTQIPLPPSPPKGGTSPTISSGFSEFWKIYPNKVGKAAAALAYARVLKSIPGPDPPGVILLGVERAKASRPWGEGFIPHPTTWLNQGRWDDEPAEVISINGPRHERSHPDAKLAAKQANYARAWEGSERAIGRSGEP